MSQELPPQLLTAYQNAGKLKLNKTEQKHLMQPFGNKVIEIRPESGAIYIPHIYLSRRLNEVFGPGEWALICHGHASEEDSPTVRAEYSLIIRGCLIGSSMGEWALGTMAKYADALEATAGEALRRICGKRLSCGDQVWMPDFIANWTEKNAETTATERGETIWRKKGAKGRVDLTGEQLLPDRGQPVADENLRHVMLQLICTQGKDNVLKFAVAKGILAADQTLENWPLSQVAVGEKQVRKLQLEIQEFFAPKPGEKGEGWKEFKVPFGGCKDQKLGEMKKEDLAGYWEVFADGKTKHPASHKAFVAAVLEAGKHYGFHLPKRSKK